MCVRECVWVGVSVCVWVCVRAYGWVGECVYGWCVSVCHSIMCVCACMHVFMSVCVGDTCLMDCVKTVVECFGCKCNCEFILVRQYNFT